MAIYRNIEMSFWKDPDVKDYFTSEDKFFFLYLLTNPYTNLCGCYEISLASISEDTGYNRETVMNLLDRFSKNYKMIRYSKETKEVFIVNWYKHNWTASAKLDKPLYREIQAIKNPAFKEALMRLYCLRDTVSIPYPYPMDTTVSVTVSEADTVTETESITKTANASVADTGYEENTIVDIPTGKSHGEKNHDRGRIPSDSKDLVKKDSTRKVSIYPDRKWFDKTFEKYPNKNFPDAAYHAWMNMFYGVPLEKLESTAYEIYFAVICYLKDYLRTKPDDPEMRYIPNFEKWLNKSSGYWIMQYNKLRNQNHNSSGSADGVKTCRMQNTG